MQIFSGRYFSTGIYPALQAADPCVRCLSVSTGTSTFSDPKVYGQNAAESRSCQEHPKGLSNLKACYKSRVKDGIQLILHTLVSGVWIECLQV